MAFGLSLSEKKRIIIAAANSLLTAYNELFVTAEANTSPFCYGAISVAISSPRGVEAFFDRALYCFEHERQPLPIRSGNCAHCTSLWQHTAFRI